MTHISTDQLDATKALTYRLREWGCDNPDERAAQFIGDLVARGWQMAANVRPIRRPPTKAEECRTHAGEWADFCRGCVSDRKARRDAEAAPTEAWTPERIRKQLASTNQPDQIGQNHDGDE